MGKINKAVFDAGPFIHLHEIKQLKLTSIFKKILTTNEILDECKRIQIILKKLKNLADKELISKSKDFAKYLVERYDIDLGESTGIALCKQENISLFFTDDLDARNVANSLGLKAHGTLAILLRAYKEKLLNKKQVKEIVESLYETSTLFFTTDLKDYVLKEVEKYPKY